MNAAISQRRKTRISTRSLDRTLEAGGTAPADENPSANPQHKTNSDERVKLVQNALQQLAEEFRHALVLKEIDGLSYDEIANVLNIPIGTVRSRIFRARKEMTERLRRVLADD